MSVEGEYSIWFLARNWFWIIKDITGKAISKGAEYRFYSTLQRGVQKCTKKFDQNA